MALNRGNDLKIAPCAACHATWQWRLEDSDPLICHCCRKSVEEQVLQIQGFYAFRDKLIRLYAQQPPNE